MCCYTCHDMVQYIDRYRQTCMTLLNAVWLPHGWRCINLLRYMWLYVCMRVCVCMYVCMCMYVCVYDTDNYLSVTMYVCVCMYVCMCMYVCVCMYVCMYVCMIQIHIQSYLLRWIRRCLRASKRSIISSRSIFTSYQWKQLNMFEIST